MKFKYFYVSLIVFATLISCSDSNTPEVINPEEVITTITATLTPQGGGTAITLRSQDLDGDGPNAPVITVSGPLAANTTYTGAVEVLNETVTPAEDVTEEVEDEGVDHQFFYTATNSIVTTTYTDMDANGDPIGITFTLTTTTAGAGNLTVTLIHEPVKDGVGVNTGDITNAGGETDAEATFPITVQ